MSPYPRGGGGHTRAGSGTASWKYVVAYIIGSLWLLQGAFLVITAVLGSALVPGPFAAFGFCIGLVGLLYGAAGLGVLLRRSWGPSIIRVICWIRIVFGGIGLIFSFGDGSTLGGIAYSIFDILLAVFTIWILKETEDAYVY
ncbi:MAG: hypothetical protein IH851_07595 [Armatimonadetes bacterium]|nr:hypothetical protein [Armatimonadota bacterium]